VFPVHIVPMIRVLIKALFGTDTSYWMLVFVSGDALVTARVPQVAFEKLN